MTTERANAIYNLTDAAVVAMLDAAAPYKRGHRPSPRAFVQILAYIGHRDRVHRRTGQFWCDDTYGQIATATRWSRSVVVDVVATATRLGVVVAVSRGGYNTATKRTLDLVRLADLVACNATPQASVPSGVPHASNLDLVVGIDDLVVRNGHPLQYIQDGDHAGRAVARAAAMAHTNKADAHE